MTTIPLVLAVFLILGILVKEQVFVFAFFAGIILDVLTIKSVGSSSLFFLIFLSFVMLYQKKYEINSYPFVLVSSFFGAYVYLLIFGRGSVVQAELCSIFAVALFAITKTTKFSI